MKNLKQFVKCPRVDDYLVVNKTVGRVLATFGKGATVVVDTPLGERVLCRVPDGLWQRAESPTH